MYNLLRVPSSRGVAPGCYRKPVPASCSVASHNRAQKTSVTPNVHAVVADGGWGHCDAAPLPLPLLLAPPPSPPRARHDALPPPSSCLRFSAGLRLSRPAEGVRVLAWPAGVAGNNGPRGRQDGGRSEAEPDLPPRLPHSSRRTRQFERDNSQAPPLPAKLIDAAAF